MNKVVILRTRQASVAVGPIRPRRATKLAQKLEAEAEAVGVAAEVSIRQLVPAHRTSRIVMQLAADEREKNLATEHT